MKEMESTPKLLTCKDAAELLGLSEAAVRKRLFLGQLPRMKLGHNVYIPYQKLMKLIEERTTDAKK